MSTLSANLYIMKIGYGREAFYKIGSSDSPDHRRHQIASQTGKPVKVIAIYGMNRGAHYFEQWWISFFWPERIVPHKGSRQREWFNLTARQVRFFCLYSSMVSDAVNNGYDPGSPWGGGLFDRRLAGERRQRLEAKRK
jgi:hypothetical protein